MVGHPPQKKLKIGLKQVRYSEVQGPWSFPPSNSLYSLGATGVKFPTFCIFANFYRAMHKRGICRQAVSVRPSVCHVREFLQNE